LRLSKNIETLLILSEYAVHKKESRYKKIYTNFDHAPIEKESKFDHATIKDEIWASIRNPAKDEIYVTISKVDKGERPMKVDTSVYQLRIVDSHSHLHIFL
jgi:hypothetical protein